LKNHEVEILQEDDFYNILHYVKGPSSFEDVVQPNNPSTTDTFFGLLKKFATAIVQPDQQALRIENNVNYWKGLIRQCESEWQIIVDS
jgi:hypothetical protein